MCSFVQIIWGACLFFLSAEAKAIIDVNVVAHWRLANSGDKFHGVTMGGLSGLIYLEGADKLVAIQDRPAENKLGPSYMGVFGIQRNQGKFQQLAISQVGVLELGTMPGILKWVEYCDLEAMARLPNGQWLMASEGGYLHSHAEILRYDDRLQFIDKLPAVDFFSPQLNRGVQKNKSLESLTATPTGKWLYTANEMPLKQDLKKGNQNSSRLVRFARHPSGQFVPKDWAYYELQPELENGLVELAAYSDNEMLALERSFNPKASKMTSRIYQVVYPASGAGMGGEIAPVLKKRLVVDLDDLRSQLPSELKNLDNFEGMALGAIGDGKRELYLVSDDNFSKLQQTIILALKITWPLPEDKPLPLGLPKS